jgi:hypothetical protein
MSSVTNPEMYVIAIFTSRVSLQKEVSSNSTAAFPRRLHPAEAAEAAELLHSHPVLRAAAVVQVHQTLPHPHNQDRGTHLHHATVELQICALYKVVPQQHYLVHTADHFSEEADHTDWRRTDEVALSE